MFLSKLSINRPIMISMLLIVFVLFGGLAYTNLPLNLMPQIDIPYVTVQTVYPGSGPKEIDTQINKRMEDVIATISKVKMMRSYAMDNASVIIIEFDIDKDVDVAAQEVRDKVNTIQSDLPEDAELPVIEKLDFASFPIVDVILTGPVSMRDLYEIADKQLKDRFSQLDGVAKVDIVGGEEREIQVNLDSRTVFQHQLSLPQISQILAGQNLDMPGGSYIQGSQEYSVRLKGYFDDLTTINQLDIPTAFGLKKMNQLAAVSDTSAEVRERSIYFDNINQEKDDHVVLLSLTKSSNGNTVKVAEQVRNALPGINQSLPNGCRIEMVRDDSWFVQNSVDDTLSTVWMGILLTGLVLLFFLHDLRSTFIVALAMPMSIISTFMLVDASGFTLNMMTLMGLSTSTGILVANSVVVLENIFRHKDMGHPRRVAADIGTAEVTVAVLASTMTNLVVFLPIASMSSLVGQMFKEFALTVTYATIFSLIISFTLTPMMASLIIPEHDAKKHPLGLKLEGWFKSWEDLYRRILKAIIANKGRAVMVIVTSMVLFIASLGLAGKIGFDFVPSMDEGNIAIEVELPQGYNLHETSMVMDRVEQKLMAYREIKHMLTTLGSLSDLDQGVNMAKMTVKLVDADLRDLSTTLLINRFIEELSDIPNTKIRVSAVTSMGGGEQPIQFYLMGQDLDQLKTYNDQLLERLKKVPGLLNLYSSSRVGKPEITLVPDRIKLAQVGITVSELALVMRSAMEGIVTTQYREGGNEYDIRVVMNDGSANSQEEIRNLPVTTPSGMYRLAQLARVEVTEGYSTILRKDKYKAFMFQGSNAPGYALGDIKARIDREAEAMNLPYGYKLDWGGDAEMMDEMTADMLRTFLIAFILTYMLLAATLESFIQPLYIMITVPLSLIGVFGALYLSGQTLNLVSMMAIIMLLGIVVNNAILMLDYTNQLHRGGMPAHDALIEACPVKLKPILMSTIAIMLGMVPLAIGMGTTGSELRQPMGIVSIGGLFVSMFLTLLVIPALYYLFTRSHPIRQGAAHENV
ncbi:MAG: efflux RND transporter permease subunit [Candidatus Delongbacteria bacterium]|nr:efflux RND transporter permease subunit [Candidatus Delongbacteria bacterium]